MLLLLAVPLAGVIFVAGCSSRDDSPPTPSTPVSALTPSKPVVLSKEGLPIEQTIRSQCAHCHRLPEPDILPKRAWESTITKMFTIDEQQYLAEFLDPQETIAWYTERAPSEVEISENTTGRVDSGLDLRRGEIYRTGIEALAGAVSNIQVHNFESDGHVQFVATDMANGLVMMAGLGELEDGFRVVARLRNPARTALIDLDQDGHLDLLVADLGSFPPGRHDNGQAIWLRGTGDRSFVKHVLGDGFGRVADVEAADFDGDGDLDVVVAEFGSMESGGVWLLENLTTNWKEPQFKRRLLTGRGGAIHAAIGDVDGDGADDIVVLHAEHYEEVSLYRNLGGLNFEYRVIHQAPHPAWGYSGLQMIDFDRDGDFDLLLTNGDGFDAGGLLQPFHGVQLLLNEGDGQFKPRPVLPFRGVHRAEAGDIDGDGDLDIAACAFHPFLPPEERQRMKLDSVIWFEQVELLGFRRHVIEVFNVDCPTLALKDYDGDGDLDITTGVFKVGLGWDPGAPGDRPEEDSPVVITWENLQIR